jgi:hypothetical protein
MPLKKLTIRDAEYLVDPVTKEAVYHVKDSHALIQAAGYLKYKYGADNEAIYFRGHTSLYGGLRPSLYRKIDSHAAQTKREGALNATIKELRTRCNLLENLYEKAREPLLQHYGLNTTWIDLVDNIWIALWFACHKAKTAGETSEYLHYERREPDFCKKEFAYISLVAADLADLNSPHPGHFISKKTELMDLRVACPSIFLRPHSQHALLLRIHGDTIRRPLDYSTQTRGIIRVDLSMALSWLGNAHTLSQHTLFPPAYYDHGYRLLVSSGLGTSGIIGSIQHVGV